MHAGIRRRQAGVTLVDAAVVLALIAVASLFAVPYLQSGRILTNETEAVRVLRSLDDAQRAFLARTEGRTYGLMTELLGEMTRRNVPVEPPLFREAGLRRSESFVQHNGYVFGVYLPTERGGTWGPRGVDSRRAGAHFVAYAWPVNMGYSGRMVFVLDETGTIRRFQDDRTREVRGDAFPPPPNYAPHPREAFGPTAPELRNAAWETVPR
jgi:hypothetical protein